MLPSPEMLRILRRLTEPTPTLSFDPYRGRREDRTVRQKVLSGVRIAGGLIAGFLVMLLAIGGFSTLPTGAPAWGRYGLLFSWGSLCGAAIIMFCTVNRWAAVAPGFFFGPALLKAFFVFAVGPSPLSSNPAYRMGRREAAELLFLSALVIALTWRFLGKRPAPTTLFDRLALTFAGLAMFDQIVIPYHWPPLPLTSALLALLAAWCMYRLERRRRRRKHIRHDSDCFEAGPEQ